MVWSMRDRDNLFSAAGTARESAGQPTITSLDMPDLPLLVALTEEAKAALGGREHFEIDCLPFRIGRESRLAVVNGELLYMERRKGSKPPNNDLYLFDTGELLNISREHLQIEAADGGGARVHDRGSACGTHVDGASIGGGDRTGSAPLKDGSEIVIGRRESPYRFKVVHLEYLRNTSTNGIRER